MPNTNHLSRQQRQLRELSAAVTRAMAADPTVHIRQHHFFRGNQSLANYAPHLRLHNEEKLEFLRGVADSLALRLQNSDATLHQKNLATTKDGIARMVFDWLESLRTESLVSSTLPGSKTNLHKRFYHWSAGFHHAGHTNSALGILLYTVAQMCWSRLSGMPVYTETEDLIEATRASISSEIGALLAGLRRTRHNQKAYIPYALDIASLVSKSLEHTLENQKKPQKKQDDDDKAIDAFALLLDLDTGQEGSTQTAETGESSTFEALKQNYQIFETRFDTQSHVADQIRPELLDEYRERINKRIAAQAISFNLLVHRLRRALIKPNT